MLQLRPLETFPVLYQISDPSDVSTYYVRAVVRNSATGATIKIAGLNYINLTVDPSNSRRFSKTVQAPNDPSGFGFWIDITVTVYTDSGYTVKSPIYQELVERYLVAERWNMSNAAGGGWFDWSKMEKVIDHARIGRMMMDVVGTIPPVKIPKFDLSSVHEGHARLEGAISAIPRPEPVDLEPHTKRVLDALEGHAQSVRHMADSIDSSFGSALERIMKRVDAIKFDIPQMPKLLDYTPQLEAMKKELKDVLQSELGSLKKAMPNQRFAELMDNVTTRMAGRTQTEDPMKDRLKALGLKS